MHIVSCTVYSKTFKGETFTFRVENGYSVEKFHGSIPVDLHCQSKRGKTFAIE